MGFETGEFHLCYKYAKNFDLPLQFVIEDNNLSTNTPTDETWGQKQKYLMMSSTISMREGFHIMVQVLGYYFRSYLWSIH